MVGPDEDIRLTSADDWLELRGGATATLFGTLDNVSPAETADSIVVTHFDWSQTLVDVPDGTPVLCKHLEGLQVKVRVRRTEDGVDGIAIWKAGAPPIPFQ